MSFWVVFQAGRLGATERTRTYPELESLSRSCLTAMPLGLSPMRATITCVHNPCESGIRPGLLNSSSRLICLQYVSRWPFCSVYKETQAYRGQLAHGGQLVKEGPLTPRRLVRAWRSHSAMSRGGGWERGMSSENCARGRRFEQYFDLKNPHTTF